MEIGTEKEPGNEDDSLCQTILVTGGELLNFHYFHLKSSAGTSTNVNILIVFIGAGLIGSSIQETLIADDGEYGLSRSRKEKWIFLSSKHGDLRYA